MNVFRANVDSSETVEFLRNEILQSGMTFNDDMTVELVGYIHNGQGFLLKVQNMEQVTDGLLEEWRRVVVNKGFMCECQYDFQEGWVQIKCLRKEQRKLLEGVNLQLFGYLSVSVLCIYRLWNSS